MTSIQIDSEDVPWASAVPFYGSGAVHDGRDIIRLKVLCDRRREGAGITWIVRFADEIKAIELVDLPTSA